MNFDKKTTVVLFFLLFVIVSLVLHVAQLRDRLQQTTRLNPAYRGIAKWEVGIGRNIYWAFKNYRAAHENKYPEKLTDIIPYSNGMLDEETLSRFSMVQNETDKSDVLFVSNRYHPKIFVVVLNDGEVILMRRSGALELPAAQSRSWSI